MTSAEHKRAAEELLSEGELTMTELRTVANRRKNLHFETDGGYQRRQLTQQMDELGKKAMGCWAQAQVHATLATIPDEVAR